MYCPQCGTKNDDNNIYCLNCGTHLAALDENNKDYDGFPAKSPSPYSSSSQDINRDGKSTSQSSNQPYSDQSSYGSPQKSTQTQNNQSSNRSSYQEPQQLGQQSSGYGNQNQRESYRSQQRYQSRQLGPKPKTRSWGLWFVISIFLLGIPMIIYNILIMRDLNKLEKSTFHSGNLKYNSTDVNVILMVILMIIFPPVYYFIKFNKLHKHLKYTHAESEHPMSGGEIIAILIGSFFFAWIPLVPLIAVIVLLYQDYKWQKTMNIHIRKHGLSS